MITLALLFTTRFSHASAPKYCLPRIEVKPTTSWSVPAGVAYFIRPAPATREITFGSIDAKVPSQILNVDTGKVTPIGGTIDPVLTPDGKVLSVPESVFYDARIGQLRALAKNEKLPSYRYIDGKVYRESPFRRFPDLNKEELKRRKESFVFDSAMSFYARAADGGLKLLRIEEDQSGNYQSLGVLRSDGTSVRYRMLFKDLKVYYQDYIFDSAKQTLDALGAQREACGSDGQVNLPMLSKDGRSMSVFSETEGVTKVYAIDERGACQVTDVLPKGVGKIDFSPDGRRLAFHSDEYLDPSVRAIYRKRPSSTQNLRAFVYDRATKRVTALGEGDAGSTYYPVFLSDDEIAYVNAPANESNNAMHIRSVKLRTSAAPGTLCPACARDPKLDRAATRLAALYASHCEAEDGPVADRDETLRWITPIRCDELIKDTSEAELRDPGANVGATVTRAQLSEVCRLLTLPTPPAIWSKAAQ